MPPLGFFLGLPATVVRLSFYVRIDLDYPITLIALSAREAMDIVRQLAMSGYALLIENRDGVPMTMFELALLAVDRPICVSAT